MNHTTYLGHHAELGMSALEFDFAEDCWAKNLRILNSDNAVLISGVSQRALLCGRCCCRCCGRPPFRPAPCASCARSMPAHWACFLLTPSLP